MSDFSYPITTTVQDLTKSDLQKIVWPPEGDKNFASEGYAEDLAQDAIIQSQIAIDAHTTAIDPHPNYLTQDKRIKFTSSAIGVSGEFYQKYLSFLAQEGSWTSLFSVEDSWSQDPLLFIVGSIVNNQQGALGVNHQGRYLTIPKDGGEVITIYQSVNLRFKISNQTLLASASKTGGNGRIQFCGMIQIYGF